MSSHEQWNCIEDFCKGVQTFQKNAKQTERSAWCSSYE